MTTESGSAPPRGGQSVVGDRARGRRDARRALYRQPVPAQFGRRDRARSRRRDRAVADRNRAALQHLFLRLRGGANAARRGARPLRPEDLHAGVRSASRCWARAVRGGARAPAAGRRARAARLRHRLLPDGAGRALCALVSAGAVLDLGRHPARRRLARRLFATAPLAFAAASFGWRTRFSASASCAALIGVLVWLIVTRRSARREVRRRDKETLRESIAGIWQVIRTPSMVRVFLVQLASYPSFVLVVGLWGGPYLTHIYGYDLKGRGDILFVAALAQVLGSFFWGPSDRLFGTLQDPGPDRRRHLLHRRWCCWRRWASCRCRCLIAVFALIGFSTGMTSVVMSHGRSLVPPHLLGRGMTLLNIGTMGGGFLVQFVTGFVIDCSRPRPAPIRWRPIGWCSACRRRSCWPAFLSISAVSESHLGRCLSPASGYEQPCAG